ncbi:hypothetical protein [Streptomyces sp. NPDC008150]|uniref:hypothetical protein n=1 Tax=Streptomyces sp. NPDC008150 TaxID=3364816 RepID=UPI0036E88060
MEDRQVVNGTVHRIRTGVSRRDLPKLHGPSKTVHTRFRRRTPTVWSPGPSSRSRPTRPGHRRQGPQLPRLPHPPAQTRQRLHHPGED